MPRELIVLHALPWLSIATTGSSTAFLAAKRLDEDLKVRSKRFKQSY
jgi:hypothetical protein